MAARLLLLLGKASEAERQARTSQGKASKASQAKASLTLPSSGLPAWPVIVNSNNNGGAKRRPPAEGGRVVVNVDNDTLAGSPEL